MLLDRAFQERQQRTVAWRAVARPTRTLERGVCRRVRGVRCNARDHRQNMGNRAGDEASSRLLKTIDVLENGGEVEQVRRLQLAQLGVGLEHEQRIRGVRLM